MNNMEPVAEFDSKADGEFVEKWLKYKEESRKAAENLVFSTRNIYDNSRKN